MAPEFIRVEETETATHLQTAVVRFTKGEASVELVGAVHIADKKYYEALNQRFEGYEALLFEGIGGDKPAAAPAAAVSLESPIARGPLRTPGARIHHQERSVALLRRHQPHVALLRLPWPSSAAGLGQLIGAAARAP